MLRPCLRLCPIAHFTRRRKRVNCPQLLDGRADVPNESVQIMPVHMQLSRIIINEINDKQVIYLREVDGDRQFPILIGLFEATSIDRRVKKLDAPRPLTHDLLAELDSVMITELREHTYFAHLRIKLDGELVEVDSRPSDAIAVAVTCDPPLPIYVDEEVLEDALDP